MSDTASLKFKNGQLHLNEQRVFVKRCFPWTHAEAFFSILDEKNVELMFIEDPQSLSLENQEVLKEYLLRTNFYFKVEKLIDIREDFELRNWQVITEQGARRFQTGLQDWPKQIPGGNFIIHDIAGDTYFLPAAIASEI